MSTNHAISWSRCKTKKLRQMSLLSYTNAEHDSTPWPHTSAHWNNSFYAPSTHRTNEKEVQCIFYVEQWHAEHGRGSLHRPRTWLVVAPLAGAMLQARIISEHPDQPPVGSGTPDGCHAAPGRKKAL